MGISEAIAADHTEIVALFDELASIAADPRQHARALRLAMRLAITLKTHALAEQRTVYEVLRTAGAPLAAYAREAPHLYHALDVVLDKLCVLRPGPELSAVVAVARRIYAHHFERETRELLPAVGAELPADEAAQLARDLAAEKARLRPRIERQLAR